MNLRFRAGLAGALLAAVPHAALACSSCGCSLTTDYTGVTGAGPGLRLDARFDFVDQNQLRLGAHAVSKAPAALPTGHEFQQGTLTRFYTLGADYGFGRDWSFGVQLPYLVREHQTIGEDQDDAAISTSETRGLGDLRIVGRWSSLSEDRSWTLQGGLKLPTGRHLRTFRDGPLAGQVIDRGIQNGSGTTDAILGLAYAKPLSRDWDHFEQVELKQPLNRADQFRPATQLTANLGLRYAGFARLLPQLQLNARVEGRETGAAADYANSGSQAIYLTPGLSAVLARSLAVYGFVQLPVYQHYSGYQLAPHYLVSIGLSYGL